MKHSTILLIPLLLVCLVTKSMFIEIQPKKTKQPTQIFTKQLFIANNAELKGIEINVCSSDAKGIISAPKTKRVRLHFKTLDFKPEHSRNFVQLVLPTSPQIVYFEVMPKNKNNGQIHYGDTISINNSYDDESITIFNDSTKTCIRVLPKKNTFLHLGKQIVTEQPRKTITLLNINLPLVTIKKTIGQSPIESHDLATNESIIMYFGDTPLTLDLGEFALQKICMWPSYDRIKDNDLLCIQYSEKQGYISLFNISITAALQESPSPVIYKDPDKGKPICGILTEHGPLTFYNKDIKDVLAVICTPQINHSIAAY